MDLDFARSRRRAATRRTRPPRRGPGGWRSTRALLVGVALFALVGGIAAEAQTPSDEPEASPRPRPTACPVPAAFRAAFAAAAKENDVPLSLLVAVAYEESRMDPDARSDAGAVGLLQVMPATARELELDATAPAANIHAGARYLRRMLDRFDGDVDLALSAYNAGPTAVERYGGAPTLETLAYVENVKARVTTLGACG